MDYQNPNYLIEWEDDPTGGRLTEFKKAFIKSQITSYDMEKLVERSEISPTLIIDSVYSTRLGRLIEAGVTFGEIAEVVKEEKATAEQNEAPDAE